MINDEKITTQANEYRAKRLAVAARRRVAQAAGATALPPAIAWRRHPLLRWGQQLQGDKLRNPVAIALRLLVLSILYSTLALLFTPVSVVYAQSLDDGLVGYWPFDEGSGATSADLSGNGNTATLSPSAIFTTSVAPLTLNNPAALRFHGAEARATGNGLDNLQQLTIAAWVQHTDLGWDVQRYVTLGNEKAVLRLDVDLHFYLTINGRLVSVRTPAFLELNRYYHVAGTYDGANLRLYLDGELVSSRIDSGTVGKGNGLLFSSSHESLDGSLDEVRIYNRALSAVEIQRLAFTCGAVSEIPQAECQALVAFYHSTNGAAWLNKTGWLSTNTPCSWYGVFCDAGSVVELRAHSNYLRGSIPPTLGNLTRLQVLDLAANQLSGPIPSEVGNLTNLQWLSFQNNQLNGSLPTALGNLTNLQYMLLHYNQMTGVIPPALGKLTKLINLSLYNNQLSGSIPGELSNLTNLQYLYLDSNQLSGSIPVELGNLTNLEEFDLYNNHLHGSIPAELGNLTNLQSINLFNNRLRGSIPATLCTLPLSYGADFGYNQLAPSDQCLATQDPDWAQTQTVPPTNVQAQALANQQVQLTWTPISYTADGGYYAVLDAPTPGGPYTVVAQTTDKTASGITLPAFRSGAHHLVVRTFTAKHGDQQNDLTSDDSTEVVVVFNTPPLVASETLTTTPGRALPIHLHASDVDADALTYLLASLPAHGLLSGAAPTLTYTAAVGFIGTDSFTFKANDGRADSTLATITLQVVAAPLLNTPPVANSQAVTTTQASRIAITLRATDGDGDPLTYQVISPPAHGILGGLAPTLIYTPTTGYIGADSFTFQVSDGRLTSAPATVQINVTPQPNQPPTPQADHFTVSRNSQANLLAVLTNDQDADGDALLLVAVDPPLNGMAQIVNGQLLYTPTADFVGADRFTYTVSDGKSSTVATVNVTVAAPVGGTTSQAIYLPLVQR